MAAPKRTKGQREQDLAVIAELYCKGRSLRDIAEELRQGREYTLSATTIARDIQTLIERWRESAAGEIGAQKARELMRLDSIEREAWREWERSRQDRKRREEGNGATGPTSKTVTEGRLADPRYLQVVQGCIDKRCALLGLNAPERREISGRDGGVIETRNVTLREVLEDYGPILDGESERLRASESVSGSEDTAQGEKTA